MISAQSECERNPTDTRNSATRLEPELKKNAFQNGPISLQMHYLAAK
jgi:hypothetical protein